MIIMALLVVMNVNLIYATPGVVLNRGAYGVYLHSLGVLEVNTDVWVHTFDIALPRVKSLPPVVDEPLCMFGNTSTPSSCSDYLSMFTAIHNLHRRAEVNINNLVDRVRNTLKSERGKRR